MVQVGALNGENIHQAAVSVWLRRTRPDVLVRSFVATFTAIWERTKLTLGDVTLAPIVDRVLHVAQEQFPAIEELELELGEAGLRCRKQPARPADRKELADGIQFVLVELLTVLGNLTADILTPALHAELAGINAPADSEGPP